MKVVDKTLVLLDPTYVIVLFVFLILLITFGIVGNVLSFITWSTGKRCSRLPISSYFKPLAIVDTCILLFPATELLLYLSPGHVVLREVSLVFCKLFSFMIYSSLRLSNWIVVTFSVEKVLHIYMPFRFPFTRNNKRVYITIAILCLISYGISLPILFDFTLFSMNNTPTTNALSNNLTLLTQTNVTDGQIGSSNSIRTIAGACASKEDSFTEKHHLRFELFFNIVMLSVMPFVVLSICNILILVKMMKRSNITIGRMDERQQTLRQKQFKYATYQVIALSIVQCLSTMPISIMNIMIVYTSGGVWNSFDHFFEVYYTFNCLVYLNSAVNFIVYCSVGSDFRQDFVEKLCKFSVQNVYGPSSTAGESSRT